MGEWGGVGRGRVRGVWRTKRRENSRVTSGAREWSGRGSARTVCAALYSAVAKACGREACLVFRVLKSVNERNMDAWPRGRRRSSAGDPSARRA